MSRGSTALFSRRWRAGVHVLSAILANRTGRVVLPRVAHFCPTWSCNQQCAGCSVWSREPEAEKQLATEGVIRMLDRLRFLDVVKIVGGEPFKRDDLKQIVRHIMREIRPYILQIVTNGSMTDRILDLASEVGEPCLNLRVSLSGIDERHQHLTGGGSFETVDRTLMELVRLKEKLGFSIGINYRLTDDTLDDFERVSRRYGPLGIDVIPGLHYQPFLTDVDIARTEFTLEPFSDSERIMEIMASGRKKRGRLSRLETLLVRRSTREAARHRMVDTSLKRKFGCRELRNLMYILPDGELIYCGLRHTPVANLARQDFNEVWFGEMIAAHREAIDDCPGCPQAAIEIFSRLYLGRF